MNWQDGLFGPGWVWSMVGTILVVVSLFGIYRQLRSSGAANALQRIETLQSQWDSPWMIHAKLQTAVHIKEGLDPEGAFARAQPLLDFFVNLDDLEKAGHITIAEIDHLWGYPIEVFITFLAPTMEAIRQRVAGTYQTESLIRKLHAYQARSGQAPQTMDPRQLGAVLDYAIAFNRQRLEQEIAWRTALEPKPSGGPQPGASNSRARSRRAATTA